MKMVIFVGSRGKNGRTASASRALLEGFVEAGGEGELVFLPDLNIERCKQCQDDGWGTCRSEGRCSQEDDMPTLIEKIKGADIVVFATPVYFGSLSESTRAFLDRLRRIAWHEKQEGIAGKKALGICVAGGGGGGASECTGELGRILATCRFDVVDMVPARRQNLDLKLEVLKLTGKWLANSI
ncbi:flavodoxin family protein [bacterium]|nr:flavodoxin family protein [bacterium]